MSTKITSCSNSTNSTKSMYFTESESISTRIINDINIQYIDDDSIYTDTTNINRTYLCGKNYNNIMNSMIVLNNDSQDRLTEYNKDISDIIRTNLSKHVDVHEVNIVNHYDNDKCNKTYVNVKYSLY